MKRLIDTDDPPVHYLGFCDVCRIGETFRTAESREQWFVTRHDHLKATERKMK